MTHLIDITPLVQALILVLAAVVTTYLIPWIRSKTTDEQQQRLLTAVKIGVYAAEKLYGAGHGASKLQWVLDYLKGLGFTVDAVQLEAMINAQIKEMELFGDPWQDGPDNGAEDEGREEESGAEVDYAGEAEHRVLLMDDVTLPADAAIELAVDEWPMDILAEFCRLNGIDASGAQCREDYLSAIESHLDRTAPDGNAPASE